MVIPVQKTIMRARISSLATFVPPRLLTNADLEKMVETSDEWITQRTGIKQRHIVDPGVATSDLAAEAGRAAIERAGLKPTDIDFIVVGTTTPDMFFPSTACLLQDKIGATHAWGYDLSAACSGFTYALTTAANMVATGSSRHALVSHDALPRSTRMPDTPRHSHRLPVRPARRLANERCDRIPATQPARAPRHGRASRSSPGRCRAVARS